MTALARPDTRLHDSWAETVLEFGSEEMHGSGSWEVPASIRGDVSSEACAYVVAELRRRGDASVPRDDRTVPSDYYWITDGDPPAEAVVGFIAVRHRLNDFLLEEGGHIGYSVRPSRRREGHASRALVLGVRRAGELGVPRALVTCDEPNHASRRTIEIAGGVYEDTRHGKRRYWIEAPATATAAVSAGADEQPR